MAVSCQKGTCFAVGYEGTLLKSTDNGLNWIAIRSAATASNLNAIVITATSGLIWVGGDKGLLIHSSDNGASWSTQKSNVSTCHIKSIIMLSELSGWAACTSAVSNTGALLYTNTGGK